MTFPRIFLADVLSTEAVNNSAILYQNTNTCIRACADCNFPAWLGGPGRSIAFIWKNNQPGYPRSWSHKAKSRLGGLTRLSYKRKMKFKVAPYSFLKSGKHVFQTQNLVHWYFVRRMKLNVWYGTSFWKSETVTKMCVTAVAMATMTFQNGC